MLEVSVKGGSKKLENLSFAGFDNTHLDGLTLADLKDLTVKHGNPELVSGTPFISKQISFNAIDSQGEERCFLCTQIDRSLGHRKGPAPLGLEDFFIESPEGIKFQGDGNKPGIILAVARLREGRGGLLRGTLGRRSTPTGTHSPSNYPSFKSSKNK